MRPIRFALALVLLVGCRTPLPVAIEAGDLAAPEGCRDDSECSGATPRCDPVTGRCVPCLPQNDNCPPGQHCIQVGDSYMCTSMCAMSGDCPRTDAGDQRQCCGGRCFDTTVDTQNCGSCGRSC